MTHDDVRARLPNDLGPALVRWYLANRRVLPWREEPTPYRVWISEIMLQQTQVTTVIPYFERWMKRFPDLETLAAADQDDVLTLWSGLGYYRRARMLHSAAVKLVEEGQTSLPKTLPELLAITGVGRYTAGAIASIAYNIPAPIVDGNVIRVLCRVFAIEGDPRSTANQKRQWALAEALIPDGHASSFNQGMMELGALICTPKKPACLLCPVRTWCQAHDQGRELELPQPRKRTKQRPMFLAVALLHRGDHAHFLMVQRPEDGLFGGLWDLPHVEVPGKKGKSPQTDVQQQALVSHLESIGIAAQVVGVGEPVKHLLSHIRLTVQPFFVEATSESEASDGQWVPRDALQDQALSSVTRKVLAQLNP